MEQFFDRDLWQRLAGDALLFLPRVVTSLVLVAIFVCAGVIVKNIIGRAGRVRRVNADVINILGSSAKGLLLSIGVIMAMGTLGIDVTAVVTGLGLTGFALGFAFKDIISNMLAGFLVLIFEPFRRNDRISVSSLEGVVTQITLRYTTLENGEQQILIPNSNLLTNPITVFRRVSDLPMPGGTADRIPQP